LTIYLGGKIELMNNNEIQNIRDDIKRTENKLSTDIKDMRQVDLVELKNSLNILNGRTRRLEVWRGFMTGGLVILGTLFSVLLFIVKEVLANSTC